MFHMEHKNYRLDIINELLNEENHARELAKILDTNHTTILRKINELFKENVVDFKIKGKNKVYFSELLPANARGFLLQ